MTWSIEAGGQTQERIGRGACAKGVAVDAEIACGLVKDG